MIKYALRKHFSSNSFFKREVLAIIYQLEPRNLDLLAYAEINDFKEMLGYWQLLCGVHTMKFATDCKYS